MTEDMGGWSGKKKPMICVMGFFFFAYGSYCMVTLPLPLIPWILRSQIGIDVQFNPWQGH
jgi:hypothetical protein